MRSKPLAIALSAALASMCWQAAFAESQTTDADVSESELATIEVTGSRIPRAQIEGPAPITTIDSEEIKASGFTSVPDVLRSLTQNGGATQSQQDFGAGDFSPGAQQVDLRGLGPNHTLVLVNGRRIADFPLPFNGRSNFTDISNIPIGMIDRVEVLTGSASAVYGSDAISGVVNFILKKEVEGTFLDVRYGTTEAGGGESLHANIATGFTHGALNAVVGVELIDQRPLWAYDREIQDSTADGPTTNSRLARRAYLRTDWFDDYIDPGEDTCAALADQNGGTTGYFERPRFGFYCGSQESIGYGTILSERKGLNAYGSFTLPLDQVELFADVQAGHHKVSLFNDVQSWSYQAPDGNEEGYFYNQATEQVEYWQRQFSPEEMGGLDNGQVKTTQKTFGLVVGAKGTFGEMWEYEASLSHSQYKAVIEWPQIVASLANSLFLGPALGINEEWGYETFNADPDRLYTPLTPAEYAAISDYTVYHPESETQTASFTVTNPALFAMPAGEAGFAGIVEVGHQRYDLKPDARATEYYFYSWKDSDGSGSRNRWATAGELRMPLLEGLDLSVAGRYDQYRFSGRNVGKATYSAGLEWRPLDTLLVRASYGTGFRAPDLHYVYAGIGNDETSGTDYYRCRTEEPDSDLGDCSYSDEGLIRTREGNRDLDPETSKSWSAGLVFSPMDNLDLSVDYFDIDMRDQVQDLRVDNVLQDEANCRLGQTPTGQAVDPNSPSCLDAIARVTRNAQGELYGIYVNPINVARETTSGVDLAANSSFDTQIGTITVRAGYTWVDTHDFQQYTGDPVEDEFAVNSGFYIPKTKANLTVGWSNTNWSTTLHGQRLGRIASFDSWAFQDIEPDSGVDPWVDATYLYNATVGYAFNERAKLTLTIDNLTDEMPPRDPTHGSYPYYNMSWFDSVGRSYFVQFAYQFGGQ
ncbi:TonB-dependent receptor [Ahniella affigens]|uniref:TonB-dependent receptor n=1 Tax=Ahniella affigens TaxID=2021234 RepID=A0A2P1PV91_9GAMM|nr:TonB-dependent receptor [Ahniella affigens]AVP98763.1 TonB-dependent receptor [Ahniella affigens]